MSRNVNDVIAGLSPARRKKVEARAAALLAEEMTLRELRAAHHKTQVSVAAALGIGQDGVSRLEQRTDLLISTLRSYVEAIGGDLELVARFPDRPPVVLEGLSGMDHARHQRAALKPPVKARRTRKASSSASKRKTLEDAHL